MPDQNTNHRRARLLVVIFVFLASVYMLTYSGRIASTDTLFLLDATGSLVRVTLWAKMYQRFSPKVGQGFSPKLYQ